MIPAAYTRDSFVLDLDPAERRIRCRCLRALDALMAEVTEADLDRADARLAILRAAWGELLPGPGGRALT